MYQLTEETFFCEGVSYTAYGIQSKQMTIKNITCNKNALEKLVALCNRISLSSIHLPEVVEDFLVDLKI
ncbi:MAG: hypothetical protein KHW59_06270 [Clostridiales bacterium]|nr:hypothetical protein [Clostridiales bacterium]